MYDTINLTLRKVDAGDTNFIEQVPAYFDITGHHNFAGEPVVSGVLGSMKVYVRPGAVSVKNGSLCKWYLGNNCKVMGRGDTQRAIEKLSDTLHLPFDRARVTRIDVAQNFITKYPPSIYLNHLGELRAGNRLQEPNGIYYTQTAGRLCFYDKLKEQKRKREQVPGLFVGRNVLRYEMRLTDNVASALGFKEVTGAMLYDESFYMGLVNRWRDKYYSIPKINDISLNFNAMRTKKDFYNLGALALIEKAGGENEFLKQITEAQKRGDLTNKQAFDLRQAAKQACNVSTDVAVKNDAINELDEKVKEAVKFYR
jgi:hypothetical protein